MQFALPHPSHHEDYLSSWKRLEAEFSGASLKKALSVYRSLLADVNAHEASFRGDGSADVVSKNPAALKEASHITSWDDQRTSRMTSAHIRSGWDSLAPVRISVHVDVVMVGSLPGSGGHVGPQERRAALSNWAKGLFGRSGLPTHSSSGVAYEYQFRFVDVGTETCRVIERFIQQHIIRPPPHSWNGSNMSSGSSNNINSFMGDRVPYLPAWRMHGLLSDIAARVTSAKVPEASTSIEESTAGKIGFRSCCYLPSAPATATLFVLSPRRWFVSNFKREVYGYRSGFSQVDLQELLRRSIEAERETLEVQEATDGDGGYDSGTISNYSSRDCNVRSSVRASAETVGSVLSGVGPLILEALRAEAAARSRDFKWRSNSGQVDGFSTQRLSRSRKRRANLEKHAAVMAEKEEDEEVERGEGGGEKERRRFGHFALKPPILWFNATEKGAAWASEIMSAFDEGDRRAKTDNYEGIQRSLNHGARIQEELDDLSEGRIIHHKATFARMDFPAALEVLRVGGNIAAALGPRRRRSILRDLLELARQRERGTCISW